MVKNLPETQEARFDPWVRKILWRRECQSTPVFLPGESHGQRSLAGYNPWDCKESDTTKWLILHYYKHLPRLAHLARSFLLRSVYLMLSCVQLFVTPSTIAHQAPLSMKFSRQEYWSGLPVPSPRGLPGPEIKLKSPSSPALVGDWILHY